MRNTLGELLAHRGVVLGRTHNAVVFIHRKVLIGHRLRQGIVRFVCKALFVGRRRRRDLAFVALSDGGDLPDSRRSRIQLVVRNRRRWWLRLWWLRLWWLRLRASLRRVHLGICGRDQEQRADAQRRGYKRSQQTRSRGLVFSAMHKLSPLSGAASRPDCCWFKTDGRLKVQYSAAQGLSGHENDTPPIDPSATDPVPLATRQRQ